MHTSFTDSEVLGKFSGDITTWTVELRKLFPVPEEYELAAEIYSFATAFDEGMSPQEAYDDFSAWAEC